MSSSHIFRVGSSFKALTSTMRYHAYTVYLFSASDIKTTLIPVSFFALGAAPLSATDPLAHALQAIFWIYLHLFKFNLANQVRDPEEDLRNKPWRPLPSRRISLEVTLTLKRIIDISCLLISMFYSPTVFLASAAFTLLVPMYHELHGDQHWFSKNLMNAVGYSCFATGGTLIASTDCSRLDETSMLSIFVIASILATTIQVQDFQDVVGDNSIGRKTLPIVFPNGSRYTPIICLVLWSMFLSSVWELSILASLAYASFGTYVGLRFFHKRSVKEDERSYLIYNMWLAISFALPGYWRLFKESTPTF